jgi:small ligand-binding sensory domain FIST
VTTPRFAAAISEHPLTAHATGEVVGQVLEALGPGPDLALVFVTAAHGGALEDVARTIRATLGPGTLVGCTAESVVGPAREVEEAPAVSLWAGNVGPVTPVRLDAVAAGGDEGLVLTGMPDPLPPGTGAMVLFADPFSFPADAALTALDEAHPGLTVVGGNASAARGPGGNRLVLDDQVVDRGAVGCLLGPGVEIATVVSQGCRPLGVPLVVTRAERNVVYEIGGRPALVRLREVVETATEEERRLLAAGLHLGRVIDEHRATFARGDFLVRNVIGADRANGAIAVGDICEVGATVQFHVRDATTADEDLRAMLAGARADAALLFTCNGRGRRLFAEPDHDARVLDEALGGVPVAGFFCAGEIGPVGGRNFLHGFTAAVALLRAR